MAFSKALLVSTIGVVGCITAAKPDPRAAFPKLFYPEKGLTLMDVMKGLHDTYQQDYQKDGKVVHCGFLNRDDASPARFPEIDDLYEERMDLWKYDPKKPRWGPKVPGTPDNGAKATGVPDKQKYIGGGAFIKIKLYDLPTRKVPRKYDGRHVYDVAEGAKPAEGYRVVENEFPYKMTANLKHFLVWDPTAKLTLEELNKILKTDPDFLRKNYYVTDPIDAESKYKKSGKFLYDLTKMKGYHPANKPNPDLDYVTWENPIFTKSIPELHHLHIVVDTSKVSNISPKDRSIVLPVIILSAVLSIVIIGLLCYICYTRDRKPAYERQNSYDP